MTDESTITEFLLARIAEDEAVAREVRPHEYLSYRDRSELTRGDDRGYATVNATSARVLAECESKRRIVELHQTWPVLVQTEPLIERADIDDPDKFAYRAVQRLQWLTQKEYRTKFGDEPPTAPIIAEMAAVYADHPDYRDEWRTE